VTDGPGPGGVLVSRRRPAHTVFARAWLAISKGDVLTGGRHGGLLVGRVDQRDALRADRRGLLLSVAAAAVASVLLLVVIASMPSLTNYPAPAAGELVQLGAGSYTVVAALGDDVSRAAGVLDHPVVGSEALAFKWVSPVRVAFWMRGVSYPLGLVAVYHGRVVWSVLMPGCAAEVCPKFLSPASFTEAYELPAGAALPAAGSRVSLRVKVESPYAVPAVSGLGEGR
jgi:uncharacterized membrane protein (UPF0127 family)